MATQLYVNRPGGVLAKFKDGEVKQLKYGDPVDVDRLADHVDPRRFADTTQRVASASPELDAHRRAALAENGQVNSSSSTIPGNYLELDEDTAAQLVSNLGNRPEEQAALVKHEILFGGNRRKVIDAAGDYARDFALAALGGSPNKEVLETGMPESASAGVPTRGLGDPDQFRDDKRAADAMQARAASAARGLTPGPSGDPDRGFGTITDPSLRTSADEGGADSSNPGDTEAQLAALQARNEELERQLTEEREKGQAAGQVQRTDLTPEEQEALAARTNDGGSNGGEGAEATDWSDFNHNDLKAYIDQHDLAVPKNKGTEETVGLIREIDGHDKPQTPPASKASS